MIRVISFDLDGTLTLTTFADEVWHKCLPRLRAEREGLSLEEAKKLCQSEYDEVGDQKPEWYDLDFWIEKFGLKVNKREIFLACAHAVKLYPEVIEVLSSLSKNFRLIVCTNAPKDFAEFELTQSGIKKFFARVYSAISDFGEIKKNITFRRVLEDLSLAPHEMVHVGDHPEFDYKIPCSVGIRAYLLDRSRLRTGKHVIHDLKELEKKL